MPAIIEEYNKLMDKLDHIVLPINRKIYEENAYEALTEYLRELYELSNELYQFKHEQKGSLIEDYDRRGSLIDKLFNLIFLGGNNRTEAEKNFQAGIQKYMNFLDKNVGDKTGVYVFAEMEREYQSTFKNLQEHTLTNIFENKQPRKYTTNLFHNLNSEEITIIIEDPTATINYANKAFTKFAGETQGKYTENIAEERATDGIKKQSKFCTIS